MQGSRFVVGLIAATLLCCLPASPARGAESPPPLIRLSVLYVGEDASREKDFVTLLQKHFDKVGKADLSRFREKGAEGYNVVILDYGEVKSNGLTIASPSAPFDKTYARPTITVGATGALVASRLKLKTGYL
jgi:hypothetical protein